jgi:hypothetical protein
MVREIVEGLNQAPNAPTTKRVARFITLFNEAGELHDNFRLYFDSGDRMRTFLWKTKTVQLPETRLRQLRAHDKRLKAVLRELNECTCRYQWHPVILHVGYETDELVIDFLRGLEARQQAVQLGKLLDVVAL